MDKALEDELHNLNSELIAYKHMHRMRVLTIETANKDLMSINSGIDAITARIEEIQNVQGTVSTVDSGSKGNSP